ncbi:MAG: UDP-N-acetylmuramate dehydrogenase [Dictyoglomus thermophilum]
MLKVKKMLMWNILNRYNFKSKIYRDVDLSSYTSFKIGGKADLFIVPYSWEELIFIIQTLKEHNFPIRIMGQGTNILVPDEGIRGAVIKLNQKLGKIDVIDSEHVEVESGCLISTLLSFVLEKNMGGLEFMIGIPGTLGGAVMGNAGAFRRSVGEFVEGVYVIDENLEERFLDKKELTFNYRSSNIPRNWILKKIILKLERKAKDSALKEIKFFIQERNKKLPKYPSAGSVFKNPKEGPAAYFIDSLGFKGFRIGDAMVSHEHANIIVNLGKARSRDVLDIIDIIRSKVKEVYGIDLEPEIIFW